MGGAPRSRSAMGADAVLTTSGAGRGFILRATGAPLLCSGEGMPGLSFRILDPSIQACPSSAILAKQGQS